MKLMNADQIPQFVRDGIVLGIEICAIDDVGYCLDDSDLPEVARDAIAPELHRILQGYGHRRHLKREINTHLNSIGRHLDAEGSDAWRYRH